MKTSQWVIEWVEDMPDQLERGKLYISTKHRLSEHLCACGCGAEVSLPLARSEWLIVYDGDSVSVWPSVGNWRLPCRSHYEITESMTRWCRWWKNPLDLTSKRVTEGKNRRDIRKMDRRSSWFRRVLKLIQ